MDVKFSEDDEILRRGEVRVRLRYPLHESVKFISSATTAALAGIFNADDEATTFGIEKVSTEPRPTDESNLQSPKELVLTAALAVQGGDTGISSMAYQANVLLQDSRPDVDRVGVKASGPGASVFTSSASVAPGKQWDIDVVLTGPNPGPAPFPYTVSTSNPVSVPIDVLDSIQQVPPSSQEAGKTMIAPVGKPPASATIIVRGRQNVRIATINISELK